MRYLVYTDAARFPNNEMCTSYFIRTKYDFIAIDASKFVGDNIGVAESLAVGIAAKYVLEVMKPSKLDSFEFNIDNLSTFNWYSKYLDMKDVEPYYLDERLKPSMQSIRLLASKCSVVVKKVAAHMDETLSGNSVADRLASKIARLL